MAREKAIVDGSYQAQTSAAAHGRVDADKMLKEGQEKEQVIEPPGKPETGPGPEAPPPAKKNKVRPMNDALKSIRRLDSVMADIPPEHWDWALDFLAAEYSKGGRIRTEAVRAGEPILDKDIPF